jgi:hypothetical protein
MGKGCEAGLSRRLRSTSIRNSGLVRSNPAILVYREMSLADYYDERFTKAAEVLDLRRDNPA